MDYLLDLIVIAIIALSTFIGYKKGLIKVAFGLVSFILAIILSVVLYKPVSNFIIDYTPIDDYIEQSISERLQSPEITKEESENIVSNFFDLKNISNSLINSSTNIISDGISKTIINISCMIVVFIISKLILLLFKFVGDLISKLPLIKQVNNAGGFLYGLIRGFLIIYVLLALVAIASPIININNLISMINKTIITNIMYNNNLILILFG